MQQKNRTIVSAVLVSRDKQILLGKVREGGVYPDCWHIPGGGMEAGETREAALIRELQEEVGLDVSPYPKHLLSDSGTGEAVKTDRKTGEEWLIQMQFHVYQIDLPSEVHDVEISLRDDLKEYVWVPMHELKNYKHTPPSEKLFRSLGWL